MGGSRRRLLPGADSPDEYRFALWRGWHARGALVLREDPPTIAKCVRRRSVAIDEGAPVDQGPASETSRPLVFGLL